MSAVLLTYSKLIATNVATQAVNLAESGTYGHRVQCPMSIDDLNRFFVWHRPAGSSAPVGHFNSCEDTSGAQFSYILTQTLNKYYTDIDSVSTGLNFSSSVLDANLDPNIREGGKVSANDIIMSYVIYRLYGSSANPTQNVIFNLPDAYGMLPTSVLVNNIEASFSAEEEKSTSESDKGAINLMFQNLLAEDPTRFFDVEGKQIPGLFEVSTGEAGKGSWNFVENDKVEMNVQFTFMNAVTTSSVVADSQEVKSVVSIPAGTTFKIRLQLVATTTPSAAAAAKAVYQTATLKELERQAQVNATAASRAADASAVAAEAVSAAQAQAATVQTAYASAVQRNKQQAMNVLSAQNALKNAQAALASATASGNQTTIQQQRAAVVSATALLQNQQAIADLASADLQNATTLVNKTTAAVNAAQTAAANAAALVATANQAAANANLAVQMANSEAIASTMSSQTIASDPLTQKLEADKEAVLNPQNLITLLATANAQTDKREAMYDDAVSAYSKQVEQINNYNTVFYDMNQTIAMGGNVSKIQMLKAVAVSSSNLMNTAMTVSQAAASTLTAAYGAELIAIQNAAIASANAASLQATIANANTNGANKALTAATTAYVYASTMNANASVSATDAQATLNARVAAGATMTEVQTRTQALLTANSAYAATTSTLNSAYVKFQSTLASYQALSTLAVKAHVNISSVAASNLQTQNLYQLSVSSSTAYQENVMSNANLNQLAIQINSSLVKLNSANNAVATAQANVDVAQLAINTALAEGALISDITVLKGVYNAAVDSLTQAKLIQQSALSAYNLYAGTSANTQVQLLQTGATNYFNTAFMKQQLTLDNVSKYSTLISYATAYPSAFPADSNGLLPSIVYGSNLNVWQSYQSNYKAAATPLLSILSNDMKSASTLMGANPSISTSLGALSNYYLTNSNSAHFIYQINSLSSAIGTLNSANVAAPELLSQYNSYLAQSNTVLASTNNAYNASLAAFLAAQTVTLVSGPGQDILNAAAAFQLAQISSATVNSKANLYNTTLQTMYGVNTDYLRAVAENNVAGQAYSNATIGGESLTQITILSQNYENTTARVATLANKLNATTNAVSSLQVSLDIFKPNSILSTSAVLQKSSDDIAQMNSLVSQIDTIYAKFIAANSDLQRTTQSANNIVDAITVTMAQGGLPDAIQPLQDQLMSIQTEVAKKQYNVTNLYNSYLNLSTIVSPDTTFISTMNGTSAIAFTATLSARLNESAQQLESAQVEETAASTALNASQAKFINVSTQFAIAKQQGQTFAQLSPLTSTFTGTSLELANTTILLNFANSALDAAKTNYNNIYTNYVTASPGIYSSFFVNAYNVTTQSTILAATRIYQASSITSAMSNTLTVNLTNAFIDMLNISTLTQADLARYRNLQVEYNTKNASGLTNSELSSLSLEVKSAYVKYIEDEQELNLYKGAYTSTLRTVTQDSAAATILKVVAQNQNKIIQGATANELYNNLVSAQDVVFKLNNEFTFAQVDYTVAYNDLQVASTNLEPQNVIDIKFSTVVGKSNSLNAVQTKLSLANSALQVASAYASMNPNSKSILDSSTALNTTQSQAAQAELLLNQYEAAVANETRTYEALQVANAALKSAQDILSSTISAGSDIATIKAARDAQVEAALVAGSASIVQNNAMNAVNLALQNANLNQISQSLVITARLVRENTTAGGQVNAAQFELNNYSTILATATETRTRSVTANLHAKSTLEYFVNPASAVSSFVYTYTPISSAVGNGNSITFNQEQTGITGTDVGTTYFTFTPGDMTINIYVSLIYAADTNIAFPQIVLSPPGNYAIYDGPRGGWMTSDTAYRQNSVFKITYDGTNIHYFVDNNEVYTALWSGGPLSSSILNWGTPYSVINNIYVGTRPPNFGLGKIEQEVIDIQSAANAAAANAVASQLSFDMAMKKFSEQAVLVSSLAETYSTTRSKLTTNNQKTTLLYNGFVFNQTFGKYVLQKSALPPVVTSGVPFTLYSITVTPIEYGTYNASTIYTLGNMIFYPDSAGAQYMCVVAPPLS